MFNIYPCEGYSKGFWEFIELTYNDGYGFDMIAFLTGDGQ